MHWKNLSNYNYLGVYSLEGITNEITVTIKSVDRESVMQNNGSQEFCIVARFYETKVDNVIIKPFILNKTNCKTISKIFGNPNIESWINKKITIVKSTTTFMRELTPCLRVKAVIPADSEEYKCQVCGKIIDKNLYTNSMSKYKAALCSKECLLKFQNNETNKENITNDEKGD